MSHAVEKSCLVSPNSPSLSMIDCLVSSPERTLRLTSSSGIPRPSWPMTCAPTGRLVVQSPLALMKSDGAPSMNCELVCLRFIVESPGSCDAVVRLVGAIEGNRALTHESEHDHAFFLRGCRNRVRSSSSRGAARCVCTADCAALPLAVERDLNRTLNDPCLQRFAHRLGLRMHVKLVVHARSEEHTSELQ